MHVCVLNNNPFCTNYYVVFNAVRTAWDLVRIAIAYNIQQLLLIIYYYHCYYYIFKALHRPSRFALHFPGDEENRENPRLTNQC